MGKDPHQVWVSGSVCFVHKPVVRVRTQGVQSMPKGSPGRTAVGGETAFRNWAFLKIKDKINMPDHKLPDILVKGTQTWPCCQERSTSYKGCRGRNSAELENSPNLCTSPTNIQNPERESQGRTPCFPQSRVCQLPIRHVTLLPRICLAFNICSWLLNFTLLDLSNVWIS